MLVLETPARNPIEISCLEVPPSGSGGDGGRTCVMSGGDVHMLIRYVPGFDEYEDDATAATTSHQGEMMAEEGFDNSNTSDVESSSSSVEHPIIVSGIVFRQASRTSVLMNDPRGKITFENCAWEDNAGETTMSIDGRYDPSLVSSSSSSSPTDDNGSGVDGGGGDVEGEEGGESGMTTTTTLSTVNFGNFMLTTSAIPFATTPLPDVTLSPFEILEYDDDDQAFSTISPPAAEDDPGRRELVLMENVGEEEEEVDFVIQRSDADSSIRGMRELESNANDMPSSTIVIENCVFSVSTCCRSVIELCCVDQSSRPSQCLSLTLSPAYST